MGRDTRLMDMIEKCGLSNAGLARELKKLNRAEGEGLRFEKPNLTHSTVRRWRLGIGVPDLEEAVLLAEFFGTHLDDMASDLFAPGKRPEPIRDLAPDERTVLDIYRSFGESTRKMVALMAQADNLVAQAQAEAARLGTDAADPAADYTPGNPGRHPHRRRGSRDGNQRTG